jgi:leader peptidase (prepilin peptidase) / N-methyltransferase
VRALTIVTWSFVGAAIGSFLNVVADRLPKHRSLMVPPSCCPACGHALTPRELIPIVSYLAQRGRCRECGDRIGPRVVVVEAITAVLFALAAVRWTGPGWAAIGELVLVSFALSVLVLITITDLEHGLILDKVSIPAINLAVGVALYRGWPTMLHHGLGGILGAGLIAAIILLVPGGMGWGDAKLAGFIGLMTGLAGLPFALFISFVSGGLIAGVLLASGRVTRRDTMPLGPFLAVGGAVTLLYLDQLQRGFSLLSTLFFS